MVDIKEKIPNLIENAAVAVLFLDHKGNVLYCNKKTESLTGCNRTEIINKNWLEVLFRDSSNLMKKEMFRAVMEDSIVYKRAKDFQCHILSASGSERLISWSITPFFNKNNQTTEESALFGYDITEIEERENSVKNFDDSLKNIFSSIKEYALYVINLDGNITYFGMGSETMLGWNKRDIIFKHVSILHNIDGDPSNLSFILEQVRLFGKYETETELITKNKEVIPVILTINHFLDANGKLAGYIFIAKDMTERKKLEYQIFQAEKLVALGQLSAGMAHEINNPLFVISGRVEMLKQEKLSPKVKENILLIESQTDRIHKLVERILKFARKSTPLSEPINLNEALEQVLPLIQYNKLPAAKIEIKKDFEKNMPQIKGDPHQLQEVFLNILINAYQSMPGGGVIKIITSNFKNLFAQIQIIDTGEGIPAHSLKDIFMPFFSTKNEGTGLGLSICYNIIKNHNGTIEVESQVNKGSTFTIKLPFI
ncbi:MAG: PAS domain-containing protein [Candidatus Omnitrophica bacterium]|nr:PAS domain-containing protein [Candidatus Omnitrophota bacterium]